jgi:hypothetical protein
MPTVTFPTPYFPSPTQSGPVALGYVYIGEVGEDPTVLANRISVDIINEDGSTTVIAPAAQPFQLNAGGLFSYNGAVVQLRVATNYCMLIQDLNEEQLFYFPNAIAGESVTVSDILLQAQGSDPAPIPATGQIYAKTIDGITEFFYMDSAGNAIQFTSGGQLLVDLSQSILEPNIIEALTSIFSPIFLGESVEVPITGGVALIDWSTGSAFSITLDQNVTSVDFDGLDAAKSQSIVVEIINEGTFTIAAFTPLQMGYEVWIPVGASLAPVSNGVTSYGCTIFPAQRIHIFPVEMEEYTP